MRREAPVKIKAAPGNDHDGRTDLTVLERSHTVIGPRLDRGDVHTTPSKVLPGVSVFVLLLIPAVSSASSVLYDNGPDAFSFSTADFIGFSLIAGNPEAQTVHNLVTENFTLSAPATIESIVFAQSNSEVGAPGGGLGVPVPTSVDYSIGTTPFGSNVANGVAVITATDLHQSSGGLHDFSSAFSAYVVLPAGTYYLTLDSSFNFLAPGFSTVAYWALTDATSGDAMSRAINENTGAILNTVDLNNEPSFQILGVLGTPPTSAPEPGTWGLLVSGLLPSQGASDAGQGALGTCDRGALGILTR